MHAFRALSRHSSLRAVVMLMVLGSPGLVPLEAANSSKPSLDQFMLQRGYCAVRLEADENNHLTTRGRINGKRVLCLIDTGCSGNVLDMTRAGSLKRLGKDVGPHYGMFGRLAGELKTVLIDHITLGEADITNQTASLYNLHQDLQVHTGSYIPTSDRKNAPDLVLGLSFLQSGHAFIYYPGPVLYVRREPPSQELASAIEKSLLASGLDSVALTGSPEVLITGAQINGKQARLLLDTGAIYTILDSAQRADYGLGRTHAAGKLVDAGERQSDAHSAPVSFKIGAFEIADLPVATTALQIGKLDRDAKQANLAPLAGVLGPELMARGGALIDCSGCKLYLRAAHQPQLKP